MSVIHISKRENPYVQIDKRVLEDPRLTWRSKGILAYLLSKPSGWKVNVKDIWVKGGEGRNAVQDCLVELQKIGYAKLVSLQGDHGKLAGSMWQVTEEPIGGFPANAERPKTGSPKNRKSGSRVHSNNESLSEIDSNNEGERTPPAPNPSNLKEEKKESGLVEPAENPETVKAEIPPSPNSAAPPSPLKLGFCGNCMGLGYRNGRNGRETCEDCDGSGHGSEMIAPTHIVTETTEDPNIKIVTGLNVSQPVTKTVTFPQQVPQLPRVATTIEAETKISEWIAGEGLETVKYRFSIAKQRFDPDNAAAIAAHYCSVYTKNPANKERLLKDPVTHFSDGLFSYLKNEESFGRDRQPGNQGPTRNGNGQTHSVLPASLRNLVGK